MDEFAAWISAHGAVVCSVELSERFDAHLCRIWGSASPTPGWRSLGAEEAPRADPAFWNAVERSRLGRYQHGFLLWSASQPGIIAPLRALLEAWVDELALPDWTFICGASQTPDGQWDIDPDALAGYEGFAEVYLRMPG